MSNSVTFDSTGRLENLPISFFAVVMGLCGFTISLMRFDHLTDFNLQMVTGSLAGIISLIFVTLLLLYVFKLIIHTKAVIQELRHPVKLNFFPTISISLLLLSIIYIEIDSTISHALWGIGTIAQFGFSLYVISIWVHHKNYEVQQINPAWLIPAVGNVIVPVAGVHHGYIELSWFFFSIGMLFWIILMTVIMYRILFHRPLDERLMPTLFILIAPPAVGFISYINLNGSFDNFARFLIYSGIFLTILLLVKSPRFLRQKFFLSWWAYSFPLAAISIACFLAFQKTDMIPFLWMGEALLFLLTLVVIFLITRTIKAIFCREICQEEH
jgi:tellurite resistance protein